MVNIENDLFNYSPINLNKQEETLNQDRKNNIAKEKITIGIDFENYTKQLKKIESTLETIANLNIKEQDSVLNKIASEAFNLEKKFNREFNQYTSSLLKQKHYEILSTFNTTNEKTIEELNNDFNKLYTNIVCQKSFNSINDMILKIDNLDEQLKSKYVTSNLSNVIKDQNGDYKTKLSKDQEKQIEDINLQYKEIIYNVSLLLNENNSKNLNHQYKDSLEEIKEKLDEQKKHFDEICKKFIKDSSLLKLNSLLIGLSYLYNMIAGIFKTKDINKKLVN